MKKIEIFDPALCCSTGVCGPAPDPQLIQFASVVKALEGKAEIVRHNLAQEPTAFSENAVVQRLLKEQGTDALPAVVIDGNLVMTGVYPSADQLAQWIGRSSSGSASQKEAEAEACCSTADGDTSSCC